MAGVTFTDAMRRLGDATRDAVETFERFNEYMTNKQIEDHFDFMVATDQFMQDGGDVWGIEVIETAFLGQPVDAMEILTENAQA